MLLLSFATKAKEAIEAAQALTLACFKQNRQPTPAELTEAALAVVRSWEPKENGANVLTPELKQTLAVGLGHLGRNLAGAKAYGAKGVV